MEKEIKKYVELSDATDKAMEIYEENPTSDVAEKAYDEAYKAEYEQFEKCIELVMELLNCSYPCGKSVVYALADDIRIKSNIYTAMEGK